MTYVSQTGRTLNLRKKEHFTLSNVASSTPMVAEHALQNGHNIVWSDAQVLASNSCSTQRCTIETWYMRCESRPINRETGCLPVVYDTLICSSGGGVVLFVYELCYLHNYWYIDIHLSIYFRFWLVYSVHLCCTPALPLRMTAGEWSKHLSSLWLVNSLSSLDMCIPSHTGLYSIVRVMTANSTKDDSCSDSWKDLLSFEMQCYRHVCHQSLKSLMKLQLVWERETINMTRTPLL